MAFGLVDWQRTGLIVYRLRLADAFDNRLSFYSENCCAMLAAARDQFVEGSERWRVVRDAWLAHRLASPSLVVLARASRASLWKDKPAREVRDARLVRLPRQYRATHNQIWAKLLVF